MVRPLSPAAYVDELGIHAPSYAEVLTYLQNGMKTIYGQDLYIEADSQDGQILTLFAKAATDLNSLAVAVYNSFSPNSAVGAGLSRLVKINGLTRAIASNSTAQLLVSGNVGAVITNGIAADGIGNQWALPASVVIPSSGSISVTAVCTVQGAVKAPANAINVIQTPTAGWISVTNPLAAVVGSPVENDAVLRQRQSISAALPALSSIEGLAAALAAINGIQRNVILENQTSFVDSNGQLPNSIQVVAEAGDSTEIARLLLLKKGQGVNTVGTINVSVNDSNGIPHLISFTRPTAVTLSVNITLKALAGYSVAVGAQIVASVIAGLQDPVRGMNNIGQAIYVHRIYRFAELDPAAGGNAYDITGISVTASGYANDANGNIQLAAIAAPTWSAANITITVI